MSHHWKSPTVTGMRGGEMSPYSTPPQRNMSPKSWSSPHQNWHSRKRPAPQSDWSPQHYNSCPSPNGYWGSPRQWSPLRWEPAPNYRRSWGHDPRSPTNSPYYKQSPEYGSTYPNRTTQAHSRRNPREISHYYSPRMVEDPWVELVATTSGGAGPSLQQVSESKTPLRGK